MKYYLGLANKYKLFLLLVVPALLTWTILLFLHTVFGKLDITAIPYTVKVKSVQVESARVFERHPTGRRPCSYVF